MPSTTASNPHVEALWWLLTEAPGGRIIELPGQPVTDWRGASKQLTTDFKLTLTDASHHITQTVVARTREELLDRLVVLRVQEKLS